MAWFARFRRRLKNYTSDGDYAGSGSSRSSGDGRDMRNAKAQGEALAHRPDRFDGGTGSAGGGFG